jgi:molybdate transport system substrate-binding protein
MRHAWRFSVQMGLIVLLLDGCSTDSPGITLGVAASLEPPVREASDRYTERTGTPITLVSGSSGTLAQQVRAGAPLDALVLADASFALALERDGLLAGLTPLAAGVLVAVTPLAVPAGIPLTSLVADPRVRHIAIATPASAPYGAAAVAALREAGAWEVAMPRLVYASDVAGVLTFVASGNADVGLVSRSLARTAPASGLTVVDLGPREGLTATAAVVAGAPGADAAGAFIAWLRGPEAIGFWERAGYLPAPAEVR